MVRTKGLAKEAFPLPLVIPCKAPAGVTSMAAQWRAWLEAQRAASPTEVPPLRPHEAKGGRFVVFGWAENELLEVANLCKKTLAVHLDI